MCNWGVNDREWQSWKRLVYDLHFRDEEQKDEVTCQPLIANLCQTGTKLQVSFLIFVWCHRHSVLLVNTLGLRVFHMASWGLGRKYPQCDFYRIWGRREAMEVPYVWGLSTSERDMSLYRCPLWKKKKSLRWDSQVFKEGVQMLDLELGTWHPVITQKPWAPVGKFPIPERAGTLHSESMQ